MPAPTPARAMVARPAPRPLETGVNKYALGVDEREKLGAQTNPRFQTNRTKPRTHASVMVTAGVKQMPTKSL